MERSENKRKLFKVDWSEQHKLSTFDQQRPLRTVVADNCMVSLPIRTLNAELTCRVCLGIIQRATTVMECLHRFCSGCIEKSLRLGQKQCPSCRVPCPSRRNLRKDKAFDKLIKRIYPDLTKVEEQQEQAVHLIISSQNHRAFARAVEEGERSQAARTRKRDKSIAASSGHPQLPFHPEPKPTQKPTGGGAGTSQEEEEAEQEEEDTATVPRTGGGRGGGGSSNVSSKVTVSLVPHSSTEDMGLPRYLRAPAAMTVRHLRKYVALKLHPHEQSGGAWEERAVGRAAMMAWSSTTSSSASSASSAASSKPRFVNLHDFLSLRDISSSYGDSSLFYAIKAR